LATAFVDGPDGRLPRTSNLPPPKDLETFEQIISEIGIKALRELMGENSGSRARGASRPGAAMADKKKLPWPCVNPAHRLATEVPTHSVRPEAVEIRRTCARFDPRSLAAAKDSSALRRFPWSITRANP
jgi:hypothetical protein